MPEPKRPLKVFLCHSRADAASVRALYNNLTKGGVDAWLDKEKLLPGQDWELEIRKAVRNVDLVIVCLSKQFNQAGFRQKEVRLALDTAMEKPEGEIFIIPARLEECDTLESLRRWHWVDLFDDSGYEILMRALNLRAEQVGAALIRKIVSRPRFGEITVVGQASLLANLGSTSQEMGDFAKAREYFEQALNLSRKLGDRNSEATLLTNLASTYEITGDLIRATELYQQALVLSTQLGLHAEAKIQPKSKLRSKAVNLQPTNGQTADHQVWSGIEFVCVPKGKFIMGDKANDEEKPQHEIVISYDYWIGRFPITNAQYAKFIKAVGYTHPVGDWNKKRDHPVIVGWELSMSYCSWLNENYEHELPHGYQLRLPTEAEWEKAARGTDGREYPWGDVFDPTRSNCGKDSNGSTTPVGKYSPRGDSPYGCADMAGNVLEWCHSLFRPYPYKADDGREVEFEIAGEERVLRGGSFDLDWRQVRCAFRYDLAGVLQTYNEYRDYINLDNIRFNHGFRVAVAPPISEIIKS